MKYCVNATLDLNGLAFGIVEVRVLYFGEDDRDLEGFPEIFWDFNLIRW